MRNHALLISKPNARFSCEVIVQLIRIVVLATWIVQSHFFLTKEKLSLKPFAMVVHPGLCLILLEIRKQVFFRHGVILRKWHFLFYSYV